MHRIKSIRFATAFTVSVLAALPAVPLAAQVGASTGPARAAAAYDAERIVTQINQQDLSAIVLNNGDTVVSEGQMGDVSVHAVTPDGLNYILIGTVCDLPDYGPGCLGVDYQVRYDADYRVTLENINLANLTFSAGKVSRGYNEDGGDTVFITHYTILDGGQKMGNLATILINVLDIAPQVADIIWPAS
jgi:hypothetical protein